MSILTKAVLSIAMLIPLQAQTMLVLAAKAGSGGGGSYTGMGDINTTGAIVAWGLQAYNAMYRGNKLVRVCDALDAHCVDVLCDASTGDAVIPSSSPDCTGSTCTISDWYDQTGAHACDNGGAIECNLTQPTIASRATLIVNCGTGKPCARRAGGTVNPGYSSPNPLLVGIQPYTMSAVAKRTGAFTTQQGIIYLNGDGGDIEFSSTADQILLYAGGVGTASAADSNWHAIQALFNSPSSAVYIDGVNTSLGFSTGANGYGGGGNYISIMSSGATAMTGDLFEVGAWTGDQSANNAAMNANQHLRWGF